MSPSIATTGRDRAEGMAQHLRDQGLTATTTEANLPLGAATHEVRLRIPPTVPHGRTYDWLDAVRRSTERHLQETGP